MSGLQGWADLPDGLLHSIAALLGSFPNLLAFASTCRSWCAAFSTHPSRSTFSTLLPPLLLQPDIPVCSPCPRPVSDNVIPKRPCHVTDLANQGLCCQIPLFPIFSVKDFPQSPLANFSFLGASYGKLFLSDKKSCLIVDVFTGVCVSPPQLPISNHTFIYHAALTAPLSSPNSHLLVSTGSYNFFWRVGSHSWLRRSPRNGTIKHIVVFKGQVFGMDSDRRLFAVHLTPHIHIQKIAVDWGGSMTNRCHLSHPWLVACGDMLLLIRCEGSFPATGNAFEAFRLDLSTEPAKCVKVEKIENWAIFISGDERSQPLSCMNPERWGGRSNCIYGYNNASKHWAAFELGKPLQGDASSPDVFMFICCGTMLLPLWVVPSMFCLCL